MAAIRQGVAPIKNWLAFPGSLRDKLAHLLFYFPGVAFRTDDLASLKFFETHDPRKLLPTLDAGVFIGGHDISPSGW